MAMAGSHGLTASRSVSLTTTAISVIEPRSAITIKNGIRAAKGWFSALRSVIFRHSVPIDYVPPSLDVIGPAVLVIEIVSVLPNIETQHRRVPLHQRAGLVWRGHRRQLAAFAFHPPLPAAAAPANAAR